LSEQQLYGLEEREQSAGWEKMPLANPIPKETWDGPAPALDDKYSGISPQEAAEVLVQQRSQPVEETREPTVTEPPPIPVQYLQQFGENAGERMPEHQTVSPEQAAHDLASWRENIGKSIEDAEQKTIRDAIDALRGEQQPVAEPQAQTPEAPVQPQPEQTPENRVAEALKDPAILSAVQEQVGRYEQAAAQAKQAWESAATSNANLIIANLAARHPELRIGFEHWPTVLTNLAASNPQRAQQLTSELQATRQIFEQALQVEQNRQQQYQAQAQQYASAAAQRFNSAAKAADADFQEYANAQNVSGEQLKAIRAEAMSMLRESMTDEQIAAEYNSNWLFRSAQSQRILMDAARWRLSQKTLAQKISRPVPPVQRPGSTLDRVGDEDITMRALNQQLERSGHWKDAAKVLVQRRAVNKR
jgi:hypothetical protein